MLIFSLLLNMQSHPTWVRGLKLMIQKILIQLIKVAPYVGAWIETILGLILAILSKSHPTWVRGLKLLLI